MDRIKQFIQTYFDSLLILLVAVSILPYIVISLYVHPAGDDFSYAFISWQNPLLQALVKEHLTWNGRYFSNAFVLLNPISFGSFTWYKMMPIMAILLFLLSSYGLIRSLGGKVFSRSQSLLIVLLFTSIYLNQLPDLSEGIYWYTAMVTYHLSCIVFMIFLGIVIHYLKGNYVLSKHIHLVIIIVLNAFLIGFNEVLMLLFACLASLAILIAYKNQKYITLFSCIWMVTFICSLIMFFAPGNATREANFPNAHRMFYSIAMGSMQTARFLFDWLSSFSLICVSILYFWFNKYLTEKTLIFRHSFYLKPWQVFGILLFVIFMGSFPAYWTTGIQGQHRTVNLVWFFFIPLWFMFLTTIYNQVRYTLPALGTKVKLSFTVFIFGAFLCSKNGYLVNYALVSGKAKAFDIEMQNRYDLIRKGQDSIYLPYIKSRPEAIFVYDLIPNSTHWLNNCYIQYFKKDGSVIIPVE